MPSLDAESLTPELDDARSAMFARACDARDARFDGVFFVGITTTRIYCRPVCPARISHLDRRRFFFSAAAAERAGYRPCLRCRPELAPGLALMDAVPRLAHTAAHRIAAGALNGRSVAQLASELHVSERHLRRALERELGVSPLELAQTHRMLLAKQLLTDTSLSVTRIAFASGFQSLRRFNSAFREHYRMAPSAIRPRQRTPRVRDAGASTASMLTLRLPYRAPFDWDTLLRCLRVDAVPGLEFVDLARYERTIDIDGHRGNIIVDAPHLQVGAVASGASRSHHFLRVQISPALVPVLMPLLSRLRQLFDMDAQPLVIDHHLAQAGLAHLVAARPGMRIPGTVDGFEIALRVIARGRAPGWRSPNITHDYAANIVAALGATIDTANPKLNRLSPTAASIAAMEPADLQRLGLPSLRASALVSVARLMASGSLCLAPGSDVEATQALLAGIRGIDEDMIASIVVRAARWPDACPSALRIGATHERWRPWRAYAALHHQVQRSRPRVPPPDRARGTQASASTLLMAQAPEPT